MILIEHHVMVKVNNISRFFRDEIEIFSNLVVRDEIKICFFYISCFEKLRCLLKMHPNREER